MLLSQALKAGASPGALAARMAETSRRLSRALDRVAWLCAGKPLAQGFLDRSSSLRGLVFCDDGLYEFIGAGIRLRLSQSRAAGKAFFHQPPQTTWFCCRHRHASEHRAFQDLGPFLGRKTLLVCHDNLLRLQIKPNCRVRGIAKARRPRQ